MRAPFGVRSRCRQFTDIAYLELTRSAFTDSITGCRCCASTDLFHGVRFAPLSGCSSGTHKVSLAFSSIVAFAILRNYDCLTDAFRIFFVDSATLSLRFSIVFVFPNSSHCRHRLHLSERLRYPQMRSPSTSLAACTRLRFLWQLSASFRSRKLDRLRCVSVCF
jgi:hypothetical protein